MTRQLQDPDLPARFPMGITGSRDEDGAGMVYVRCNDGSLWLDTGNATVPWRRLPAIPEPTAEEVEALEASERKEEQVRRAKIKAACQEAAALVAASMREDQARLRKERMEIEARRRESAKKAEQPERLRPHWWLW
jgi:hypothetical protein